MTIKDIAKESGYSVSTVSRVLNNRRDVSPEAKKRISEIVAAYNFIPNNNAKHLKQSTSKNIAVLVKGTSNMLFANIVEEVQKMLEETKYSAEVCYIDEDKNEVEQALILCRERKPMGILFLGGNPSNFQEKYEQIEVPGVLITNCGKELPFENLSSVSVDDIAAAKQAMDYLLENKHKNIGILGGDITLSHTSQQRYLGCLESFKKHGLDFDKEKYYENCRFSFDSAYRAMVRLLEKAPDITAIFAMADVTAIGAIRALKDKGFNVPEDISVIGFDGIELADYYKPKLTTIKQPARELAIRGVEILFNFIDFQAGSIHETVRVDLITGESVKKLTSGGEG